MLSILTTNHIMTTDNKTTDVKWTELDCQHYQQHIVDISVYADQIHSCLYQTVPHKHTSVHGRYWGKQEEESYSSPVTILLLLQLLSCKPQLWGEIECDAASFRLLSSKRRFLLLLVWPDANVIIYSISWYTRFFTPGTDVLVLDLAHYYKFYSIRYGEYMAHLDIVERRRDPNFTYIPWCIYWNRKRWKILRDRLNKLVPAKHQSWKRVNYSYHETIRVCWLYVLS